MSAVVSVEWAIQHAAHVANQAKLAILLSTHRLHEIEHRCDRFVIIHGGHVVAQGTPTEILGACGNLEEAFFAAIAAGAPT